MKCSKSKFKTDQTMTSIILDAVMTTTKPIPSMHEIKCQTCLKNCDCTQHNFDALDKIVAAQHCPHFAYYRLAK